MCEEDIVVGFLLIHHCDCYMVFLFAMNGRALWEEYKAGVQANSRWNHLYLFYLSVVGFDCEVVAIFSRSSFHGVALEENDFVI